MKLLYVVNLYSGLADSIREGHWQPSGSPTAYKLIEALAQADIEARILLTCKDTHGKWQEKRDRTLTFPALRIPLIILAGRAATPRWLGRLRGPLREFRQALRVLGEIQSFKPDLIYFDRINFRIAGIFARLFPVPVLLRVMGVTPALHRLMDAPGLLSSFDRWCFKSPFATVLFTQDGSGVEYWARRALHPQTPYIALLNGVVSLPSGDVPIKKAQRAAQKETVVLFVGRLETIKAAEEFLEGFLMAWSRSGRRLRALIADDGELLTRMKNRVSETNAQDYVTFTGRIPHAQMGKLYEQANIYVSLNTMGNLSNSNLEAAKAGICMIIPAALRDTGIDVVTEQLFPPKTAWRIPHARDAEALAHALLWLHQNPEEREARAKATAAAAEFIPTWDKRVEVEVQLLKELASGTPSRVRTQVQTLR